MLYCFSAVHVASLYHSFNVLLIISQWMNPNGNSLQNTIFLNSISNKISQNSFQFSNLKNEKTYFKLLNPTLGIKNKKLFSHYKLYTEQPIILNFHLQHFPYINKMSLFILNAHFNKHFKKKVIVSYTLRIKQNPPGDDDVKNYFAFYVKKKMEEKLYTLDVSYTKFNY